LVGCKERKVTDHVRRVCITMVEERKVLGVAEIERDVIMGERFMR